jgi:hypothetical protein
MPERGWGDDPRLVVVRCLLVGYVFSYVYDIFGFMSKGYAAVKRCYKNLRIEFLEAYGNKCACCGETETDFLTCDHIHGSAKRDRRDGQYGGRTKKSYEMLTAYRKLGWPKDKLRILCWNCNCGRAKFGNYGVCPHEKKRLIEAGQWPPSEIQQKMIQAKEDFGQQLLDLMLS